MGFLIGKYYSNLFRRDESVEFGTINLTYKDGTIHTMIAYTMGAGDPVLFGFTYRGNERIISKERFAELYGDITQLVPNTVYHQGGSNISASYYIEQPGYCIYNSERKLGIYFCPIAGGQNVNFCFVIRNSAVWSYASDTHIYTANVGNQNSSTFWDNVESGADGRIPWKEDNSTTGGGKGKWDDNQTDPIGLPDLTTLNSQSFANTLFVSTYRLTNSEVQALGREFWKPSFIEQIIQKFENPMDSIISLSMIPVDSVGSAKEIIIGGYRTGISSHLIGNQFVNLPCGSVEIPEKWGGAIDYHSGLSIYLPFIGVEQLDPQECIGATIAVNYYIDIITGACIAFVKITRGELNSVLYHFTGNCSFSLPLTKQDYTAIFNAIVGASATAIGTVASGGSGIMASVATGSNMLTSAESHTAHSGSMGGNTGIMGIKKPYIILSRPIQSLPADFGSFRGFPSNITETLSSLKGFTKIKEIHLENIWATDAETAEIEQLLKSGVIIK